MFISLRNHTTFSLCKGAIKIQELIDAAIADKMPALGISDCGNLFAALEFSTYCKKAGIQPILSAEMLVDFGEKDLRNASNLDIENSLAKMPLIAATEEGYKNLMYLVSYSFLNRENGLSPHIKFALLKEKSKGLIALSGAVEGIVGKMLHDGQEKKLDSIIVELQKTFLPQNFYIEITRHGTEAEKKLEEKFIATAFKHNAPLVATNDVYFISEEMHEAQDILNCIGEGRFFIETDRKKNSPQQYFKTQKAMEALFADLPEALENTVNIAKKCSVMAFERPPTLPKFIKACG
jgi:DNA polymerase III subunit alpha